METNDDQRKLLIMFQKDEITGYVIYNKLAAIIKNKDNSAVLAKIAQVEKNHYYFWKNYTDTDVSVSRFKVIFYIFLARVLGLTFAIKLMEKGEKVAQSYYKTILGKYPESKKIVEEEEEHERELVNMIEEEKLNYIGSIVLGLNDALVELTGTLAGLTFALQNTHLTALVGLITGIAASFSMAASEYLSNKSEGNGEKALRSSIYTGVAYICTVALLVLPYFIFTGYLVALLFTLVVALFIIFFFNYYISVAKDFSFKRRFFEMTAISLSVAVLSFGIGFVVRKIFGIDV